MAALRSESGPACLQQSLKTANVRDIRGSSAGLRSRTTIVANNKNRILIAGGGIGGITALLALRQRGIEAELFEQAKAFSQVGAGLQVSGNATKILRTLGLGEALAKVAYYPQGRDYRDWNSGE